VIAIGIFLAAALGTLVIGLVSSWVDRKVTARVQYRVGPPFFQPVYDIAKLLGKETLLPERAQGRGFLLAPVVGFAAAGLGAAILWHANLRPGEGFVGDLIVLLYVLTIPAIAAIYGGLASGSPHATVGASREMKLLLSYELPLVLAVLVPVVQMSRSAEASFSVGSLVVFQQTEGWTLFSLSGVIAMIVGILWAAACHDQTDAVSAAGGLADLSGDAVHGRIGESGVCVGVAGVCRKVRDLSGPGGADSEHEPAGADRPRGPVLLVRHGAAGGSGAGAGVVWAVRSEI